MKTTFNTFAEAEAAGFERVNPREKGVEDISGPNSFGYSFRRNGVNSVMIYGTTEINRVGGRGAHRAYWPPVEKAGAR